MTDTTTDKTSTEMDSWAMACSVLVGMWKAMDKARDEHARLLAEHYGKPFAPGASTISATLGSLMEAERSLQTDLRRIARTSGFPVPEKVLAAPIR